MNNIDSPEYQSALKRIMDLSRKINKNSEILASKEEVMSKYQKLFSPSNIKNIEKDEFIEFLPFRNNHHWSGLLQTLKQYAPPRELLSRLLHKPHILHHIS